MYDIEATVPNDDKAASWLLSERTHGVLDISVTANRTCAWHDVVRVRGALKGRQEILFKMTSGIRTKDDRGPFDGRRELYQQFQPFSSDRGLEVAEPGYVATGTRQRRNKASADWIAHVYKHYR